jgi:hypothetical protein
MISQSPFKIHVIHSFCRRHKHELHKSDPHEFSNAVNNSIITINSWFISNLLSINTDKVQFLQFLTKNSKLTDLSISYENNHITKVQKVKFLGLTLDNYVMEYHIEEIIPKLNKACFAIGSVRPYLLYEVVRMMHFSYFHSIMSYSIIFWGNWSQNNSIFKIQKRTIRVIVNSSSRTSGHELFKELQILTPHSEYVYPY